MPQPRRTKMRASRIGNPPTSEDGLNIGSVLGQGVRLLVQQQPIESDLADGVGELREVDGFDDVAVHAQVVALNEITLLARGAEHYYGNAPRTRVGLQLR